MKTAYLYGASAMALAVILSFHAFAATGSAGTSSGGVTEPQAGVAAAATASAKKVLAQLEESVRKVGDMIENVKPEDFHPEAVRAEIDKARAVVNDAVDRVSVTGGRGTQRNLALRQMQARLERFRTVVEAKVETKTKLELKNLKDALKKVEAAFRH
jgi:hypothetical protein